MIIRSEEIYKKANSIVRSCGTRDTLKIARELGIYVHYIDTLNDLLGMYTYRHKERHILLNSGMEHMVMQMVCGHEIGHDVFHRDLAKKGNALPEFTLFDMRSKPEYEANAFAAHLIIDNDELVEYMQEGYDVVQLSAMMGTNINLMLIKLNEMNRMGWGLNLPYVPQHYIDTLNDLLGMYTYRHKERHILLNSGMEHMVMQMVCGHEIGHDVFHRDLAKKGNALPEFTLFDMRSKPEYEANAFAAHLIIDNDELVEYMQEGYDVVQLSAMMGTNINLMLIKLNEMNRMGWGLNLPYVPHADFLKQIKPEG